MPIKAIVFDFDGVILPDSQHAKDVAYLKLFPGEEKKVATFLPDLALRYGGGRGDRKDIIRDLFEHVYGKTCTQEELDILVGDFIMVTAKDIDRMVPPISTVKALKELSRKLPLYVASGTPHQELLLRISRLGLSQYFRAIWGRPTTKTEAIHLVLSEKHIQPEEILLVGDEMGDYETAKRAGTTFVGIKNEWNSWPKEISIPLVPAHRLGEIVLYVF